MLVSGDAVAAMSGLTDLVVLLRRHVEREKDGIFRAQRVEGEFVDEVDALQEEHRAFEMAIAVVYVGAPDFDIAATRLLDDLMVMWCARTTRSSRSPSSRSELRDGRSSTRPTRGRRASCSTRSRGRLRRPESGWHHRTSTHDKEPNACRKSH